MNRFSLSKAKCPKVMWWVAVPTKKASSDLSLAGSLGVQRMEFILSFR